MNKAEFAVLKSQKFYLSKLQARIRYLSFCFFSYRREAGNQILGDILHKYNFKKPKSVQTIQKTMEPKTENFPGMLWTFIPSADIYVSVVEVQLYHSLDNSLETMISVKAAPGAQEFL